MVAKGDAGSYEAAQSMISKVNATLGNVGILINNAGLSSRRPITEITVEHWCEVVATNLDGPFPLSQAVIPAMVNRG